jgi:hypothetical protein
MKMKQEKLLDFLLSLSGSLTDQDYSEYNVLMLEIVYFLVSKKTPAQLLIKETVKPKKDTAMSLNTRHSRFGGSLNIEFVTFSLSIHGNRMEND